MKQNGVRLVQRKFAQGVPIPASNASAAPAPPERKPEQSANPINVYHNNMSARSLLDMISMQNIHKHKHEPLVLLERLREDEIPPPAPGARERVPRMRVALRRRKLGAKGNMCLRSGKRKAVDTKGPVRKRKKLSSESTDDIPLVYYFNRPAKTPHPAIRPKSKGVTEKHDKSSERARRTPTPNTSERRDTAVADSPTPRADSRASDDRSFTFKEPPSPGRLSYRLFKKQAAARAGRPVKKVVANDARWSTLRSARALSESRGMGRRLRSKVLLGKKPPKPSARKSSSKTNKDEPTSKPGPASTKAAKPPSESPRPRAPDSRRESLESIERFLAIKDELNRSSPSIAWSQATRTPTPMVIISPSPLPSISSIISREEEDWCIPPSTNESVTFSNYSSDIIKLHHPPTPSVDGQSCSSQEEAKMVLEMKAMNESIDQEIAEIKRRNEEKVDTPTKFDDTPEAKNEAIDEAPVPINVESNQDTQQQEAGTSGDVGGKEQDDKTKRVKGKGVGKKSTPKGTKARNPPKEPKKTLPKRAAKATTSGTAAAATAPTTAAAPQDEASTSTRLLRNSREPPAPPANPDVYEFDAELESSRPPSCLRRRDPAHPNADAIQYMDILPASSHFVKIIPKKDQEEGKPVLSVSLVHKDDIYQKQKNLIDNVTNSPALLNKLFNCLPTELQNELGNLAAEGSREEAYLEEKAGSVLEAPTYYPTVEEFEDPIKYYDKIAPEASKYGLCKIVPPASFKPVCTMSESIRFAVIYQYISKMYSRWGPVSRELAAIKAHLRTQSVVFARSPLLDGSEVNLPKLYHAVERNGGLSNVIQRKRWGRVAEEMKLTKLQHPERKLDPIYMRYLLPYATLSDQERQNIMAEVEKCWTTKYQKMLERARNPFQRQNRMLGTECESESDDEADGDAAGALHEAEDCIVQGRTMNLITFKKIATSLMDATFEPSRQPPSAADVEKAYWRAVLLGTDHIVANTASIDTGEEGYGFPKDPEAEYGTHPWNLKVLARNPNNVLRYLGAVLGVTVPTLHMSMLFSTSCWHRDPHGLPWTEYMHSGAEKIWYGIPRDESANFRRAVETLCPAYCQNKSIWLASEITMVPPNILREHGVKLSRVLQKPGEYVLVFPEAHSCSITTGFGISESVYFASNAWLSDVYKLFQELRKSCEPTMFSLEQLLLSGSGDERAPPRVRSVLATLLAAELDHRRALETRGLQVQERPAPTAPLNTSYFRAWNTRDQDECEYCRSTLFLSKVTGLPGRKSAVCPEHALRLLECKKHKNTDLATVEFLSSYSTLALEDMLERLEDRVQSRPESVAGPSQPAN